MFPDTPWALSHSLITVETALVMFISGAVILSVN